jgi:hypothetical protein
VYYSDFQRQTEVFLALPECLGFFFFLLALVFIPLGQRIGEGLKSVSPALKGYIINILGSLTGVLAFAVILARISLIDNFTGHGVIKCVWSARKL